MPFEYEKDGTIDMKESLDRPRPPEGHSFVRPHEVVTERRLDYTRMGDHFKKAGLHPDQFWQNPLWKYDIRCEPWVAEAIKIWAEGRVELDLPKLLRLMNDRDPYEWPKKVRPAGTPFLNGNMVAVIDHSGRRSVAYASVTDPIEWVDRGVFKAKMKYCGVTPGASRGGYGRTVRIGLEDEDGHTYFATVAEYNRIAKKMVRGVATGKWQIKRVHGSSWTLSLVR